MAQPDHADDLIFSPPLAPEDAAAVPDRPLRGVIADWGGVMTTPIVDTVLAWLDADGIDRDSYRTIMRAWVSAAYDGSADTNPIHALERGECTEAEFERQLAQRLTRLDGTPVLPDGLLAKMFAASAHDEQMHDLIRAARRAGLRTGLLSNSWGGTYPRHLFPGLFDAVVISAEVGMRKPEPRIFLLAAEVLGLDPAECVFIDDVTGNVTAARAAGMTAIHHRTATDTAAALFRLLGKPIA